MSRLADVPDDELDLHFTIRRLVDYWGAYNVLLAVSDDLLRFTRNSGAYRREFFGIYRRAAASVRATAKTWAKGANAITRRRLPPAPPADLVNAIVKQLDGQEWDADTLDRIAAILRRGGRTIRDTDGRIR